VLCDKKNQTIVNNESSGVAGIFDAEFNDLIPPDIYPEELRNGIDSTNDWVYSAIDS